MQARTAGARLSVFRAIVGLLLGGACMLGHATSAGATVPGHNGKIVFVRSCDGTHPAGDIWSVNPDGSALTQLTSDPTHQDRDPAWSPDGTKIAFWRRPGAACYFTRTEAFLFVMNADGTNQQQLTFDDGGPFHADQYPDWSPDGSKIVFVRNFRMANPPCSELYVVNSDGTNLHQLAPTPHCHEQDPAWSADGTKIAYTSFDDSQSNRPPLYVANADNANPTQITDGISPSWQPGGHWIASSIIGTSFNVTPDGSYFGGFAQGGNPDWSPDSMLIVADTFGISQPTTGLFTFNTAGRDQVHIPNTGAADVSPAWQPLQPPPPPAPGYPRPRGASPLIVALVPAFQQCTSTSANSTHGAPLAYPSCAPPVPTSTYLTIGTPDANGQGANSTGSVRVAAIPGNPTTMTGADIALSLTLTDVRCMHPTLCASSSPFAAYEGDLETRVRLPQITDRDTGGTANGPSTFNPTGNLSLLRFPASCAPTSDPSVGSTCQGATTINALVPGAVKEGERSIWELGQVQVFDGGANGVAKASDAKLFEAQGVFVP